MSQAASQAAAFYRDVANTGRLWTIEDEGGYPSPMTQEGKRAMPFWSSLARARKIVRTVPAYSGFTPVEFSWEQFKNEWLPELQSEGQLVGVNWSGARATGYPDFLFSYGTLQLEAVQMATFGRRLTGTGDILQGFELVSLKIEDQTVVKISGKAHHTMARFTGRDSDVVCGTLFTVTPDEIQNADKYEGAAVKRVAVVLQSGVRAWAYVDARSAPSDS